MSTIDELKALEAKALEIDEEVRELIREAKNASATRVADALDVAHRWVDEAADLAGDAVRREKVRTGTD